MNKRRAFIIGIKSTQLLKKEKNFLKKYKPWGVILFTRNIKNIEQTFKLTSSIRKIFNDKKYPILIDQEGGRVNRLKNIISFDNLTSEFFGKKYIKNIKEFKLYYKLFIDKTSFLLKSIGVNVNTSPVLDLRVKGSSNIIGNRSFSKNPKIVSKIGDFCIDYFHKNSIGTVMKHIPGHGLAKVDSHNFTPIIKKNLNYLKKNDFVPFRNKKIFFAMTAHIIFEKIDNENTVTHSKKLIKLIRNKIGFKNILISDDLSMKSLKYSLEKNTIKTFNAGCNIALHCNGNLKEMEIVGKNAPLLNKFILKKTSQFYKILS
ncbi:glycoside hydrolase family 3 N-terminal domain-containing protein [Candidatus Pelagibacter sp. HIMB1483]|uniref:glycoside hydrolase family 3 N-terminal domain-containing protein n=1 Tax=Candidatus Pelagibacter sp. HIMB1483 TaxID=3415414 RepID=UPI003F84C8E8